MTMMSRNFVLLNDLIGLEVECQRDQCGALVLIPFDCSHELPNVCPACKEPLFLKDGQLSHVKDLIKSLSNIEARKVSNIRLEISAENPE